MTDAEGLLDLSDTCDLEEFELIVFTTDEDWIPRLIDAGVDAVIVDWEWQGKHDRQLGADTQVNHDSLDDLRRVRRTTDARIICRINGPGRSTETEIGEAAGAGADEILVPMVRTPTEIAWIREMVDDRCGLGILIETPEAVTHAATIGTMPLSRVYIGLNDLTIARRDDNLFAPLTDGTVDRVRSVVDAPFGVAGLTLPSHGQPIPVRLLAGEILRLGCGFSFLRRSFWRDLDGRDPADHVPRIRTMLERLSRRSPREVAADHRDFVERVASWQAA